MKNDINNNLKKNEFTLWYSTQEGEMEKNQLTLDADGSATVMITHSRPGSPLRALGWFYSKLDSMDPHIISLKRIINEYELFTINPFQVAPIPGLRAKNFSIKKNGREINHYVDASKDLPVGLAELEMSIYSLINRLGSDAKRTMEIGIQVLPNRLAWGDNLRVMLEISNDGVAPTFIRNFAGFRGKSIDLIKLNIWYQFIDEIGKERYEYIGVLDLNNREWLVDDRKAVNSSDLYLEIAPDSTQKVWAIVRCPKIVPKAYLAQLVYYAAPLSEQEEQSLPHLVVGEYHSDTVPLVITGISTSRKAD